MKTGPGRFAKPSLMEVQCLRSGVWRVEGYDVERHTQDGKDWWHVFLRRPAQEHEGGQSVTQERFCGKRRSLTEACALIDDLLGELA